MSKNPAKKKGKNDAKKVRVNEKKIIKGFTKEQLFDIARTLGIQGDESKRKEEIAKRIFRDRRGRIALGIGISGISYNLLSVLFHSLKRNPEFFKGKNLALTITSVTGFSIITILGMMRRDPQLRSAIRKVLRVKGEKAKRRKLTRKQKIGIGVGVGAGVMAVTAGIGLGYNRYRKRNQNKTGGTG